MPIPNGGLITETNEQYYAGAQRFLISDPPVIGDSVTTTFNTDLTYDSANASLTNFVVYTSLTGLATSYSEFAGPYTVVGNTITFTGTNALRKHIAVQLKSLDGGSFGNEDAFGDIVQENYGSYAYTSLNDVINGFIATYVGEHKLIGDVKRTDVIFHAKRGLQEFSYDTLKRLKSQEITIPPSLGVTIPQDYVNYVSLAYIDQLGVRHPIYPANNLTSSPYEVPLQDAAGDYTMDNLGDLLEGTSITNERWATANDRLLNGSITFDDYRAYGSYLTGNPFYGQRYGNDPQTAQRNGWFNMNERDGTIAFFFQLKRPINNT